MNRDTHVVNIRVVRFALRVEAEVFAAEQRAASPNVETFIVYEASARRRGYAVTVRETVRKDD